MRPNSRMKTAQKTYETPLIVVPNKKVDEIEQEVKQNLFVVPAEEDILKDIEEVGKAKELEKNWKELKKQQEIQETIISRKKLEKIEEEQKRLADRLEQLVNNPQLDESEEKYKLIALRRRIEQDHKEEQKKLQEQFLISKEHDIEKIVRKKIEMENLIEKKKKMNDDLKKLQNELEAIQEIKDKKDLQSQKLLNQALKRMGGKELADNAFLTEQDKVLLADTVLDDKIQGLKQKELILMEVQSKVQQQRSKSEMETQNRIRKLNEARQAIADKQEKILMEKAIHGEIMKKGIDYLTEIELGNAPPMEYIKKNVKIDDDKLDQYRNNLGVKEIAKKGRQYVAESEDHISKLKMSQKMGQIIERPYNNDLKPYLNQCKPESIFIARKIVDLIIDMALRQILEQENKLSLLKERRYELDFRGAEFRAAQNKLIDREFIDEMADTIFNNVMRIIEKQAAKEIATVNLKAQSIALNIIRTAVKNERNSSNTVMRIQELYFDLREGIKKKDTGHKFNFLNQQEIDWKKVKKGKKNYNQQQLQKQTKDKKKQQQPDEQEKKKVPDQEQKEEDDDLDVQQLDPNRDCVDSLGLDKVKDYESQYWERVIISYLKFRDHTPSLKLSVTYLGLSPFKEYVIVGMSNGEVYLYDTTSSPASLISINIFIQLAAAAIIPSSTKQPVIEIQYGMDNIGHLAILEQGGNLRVCINAYNLKTNVSAEALKDIEKLPESFQPMFYIEYLNFDYKYCSRRQQGKDDQINLKPTYGTLHPGLTFSCLQPSLILGTQNGTVMKFNSNKDLFTGKNYKFPVHNVLNSKVIVNEDVVFPEDMNNFLQLELNKEGTFEGKNPHIYREFFNAHKAKIVYIGYLKTPERIITVDADGYIFYWEYDNAYFDLRKKGFFPKIKYRVMTNSIQYIPVQNDDKKVIFPPPEDQQLTQEQIQEKGKNKFEFIYSEENENIHKLFSRPLKNGLSEIIICENDLPEEDESTSFEIYTVNMNQQRVISGYMQEYKGNAIEGYVSKVKSSLVSQYLYLQIVKPHSINADLVKIEFVGVNTNGAFRLKKLRPELETPAEDYIDFIIVDYYYPFQVSYLFVNTYQGIVIISLATGNILKVINEHLDIVKTTLPLKQLIPNGIQVIENESMFITFKNSNGVWRFDIIDENDEEEKQQIYEQMKNEYWKLFTQ